MGHRGQQQRPRRGLLVLVGVLTLVVLALDQISKQVVLATLDVGEFHPLLGDFLGLSLVFNPGAAFSLAEGSTWVFTIAAVVVTVVIVRISRRLGSRGWAVALGALLGGTLGNLGDRLFREPGFAVGHVVDFINYNGWFVGNVADIAIVLSAIGIAVLSFSGIGVDGRRTAADQHDGEATEGRHVATPEDVQETAAGHAGAADDAEAAEDPQDVAAAGAPVPAEEPEQDVPVDVAEKKTQTDG